MERLYAGADMLVLPTIYEQGSRAAHEAAACGLPLVATPVHGVAPADGRRCGWHRHSSVMPGRSATR